MPPFDCSICTQRLGDHNWSGTSQRYRIFRCDACNRAYKTAAKRRNLAAKALKAEEFMPPVAPRRLELTVGAKQAAAMEALAEHVRRQMAQPDIQESLKRPFESVVRSIQLRSLG